MLQINEVLRSKKRNDLLLSDQDIQIIQDFIKILEPFEEAIKKFEGSKEPTIQNVVPQYHKLKSVVRPKAGDTLLTAKFRSLLQRELEDKFFNNISQRHKLGVFLWPKFASLPFMGEEERSEVRTIFID